MSYREEMRAGAEQGRFGFETAENGEQTIASLVVTQNIFKLRHRPTEALDRQDLGFDESRIEHFSKQILRSVKKGCCEVLRMVGGVAVLTISEITFDDLVEIRVGQKIAHGAVDGRGESGDGGREQQAARPQDSTGFLESLDSVLSGDEVVERTEKENRVDGSLAHGYLAGVRDLCAQQPGVVGLPGGFDVAGHRIE
jgi:hypothetical protein